MDSLGRGGACRGGIIGSWVVILDMADDCAYGGIEWCDGWRVESIMCLAQLLAWVGQMMRLRGTGGADCLVGLLLMCDRIKQQRQKQPSVRRGACRY